MLNSLVLPCQISRCIVYSIQMQKASELARRGESKRQAGDFVSRQEWIGWRDQGGFVAITDFE